VDARPAAEVVQRTIRQRLGLPQMDKSADRAAKEAASA
jgi:hypothetical protein